MESAILPAVQSEFSAAQALRPSFLRRVGPGVFGFLAIAVLSHATDSALRAAGVFSALGLPMTSGAFAVATAYRSAFGVLGCFIAARFAAQRPMRNAMGLGAVGFMLSTLGVAAAAHRPELGPLWYPLALALLTLPCAWLGGKLGSRSRTRTQN